MLAEIVRSRAGILVEESSGAARGEGGRGIGVLRSAGNSDSTSALWDGTWGDQTSISYPAAPNVMAL